MNLYKYLNGGGGGGGGQDRAKRAERARAAPRQDTRWRFCNSHPPPHTICSAAVALLLQRLNRDASRAGRIPVEVDTFCMEAKKSDDLNRDGSLGARIPIEVDTFLRGPKSVDLNRDGDYEGPRGLGAAVG